MSVIYALVILSSLYIAIIGLFFLFLRAFMLRSGSSTLVVYKLWWIFIVGFVLLFSLYFIKTVSSIPSAVSQFIQMPTLWVSYRYNLSWSWKDILLIAMMAVSVLLLSRLVINYFNLKKALLLNSNEETFYIKTPFLKFPVAFGVLHPTVFVPCDFQQAYNASQQRLLLAHERVHCTRFDPLLLVLYKILVSLFWFHPVIYLVNSCIKKDLEISCDEHVLNVSKQASKYSKLLLQLNQQSRPLFKQTELYCSSSSLLKERIMLIKNLKPQSAFSSLVSRSLLALSIVGLFVTTTVLAERVILSDNPEQVPLVPKPPSLSKSPASEPHAATQLVALSTPRPLYPRAAAVAKISGYVVVEFDVLTDGSVKNPVVVDSKPKGIFDVEAIKSVQHYKFAPVAEQIKARRKVKFSM